MLQELARIGFADIRDLFEWDEERAVFVPSRDLTADQAAAVASVKAETTRYTKADGDTETRIKLEIKCHDKLAALREIGKHLGVPENVNLHTPDGPLQVAITYQVVQVSGNGPPNRVLALEGLAAGNGSGKQP